MSGNVSMILCPELLEPGGLRVFATAKGVSRLELWERTPAGSIGPAARSLREGSSGGPCAEAATLLERAVEDLEAYFEGRGLEFHVPLDLDGQGSPFQRRVWHLLRGIAYATTWTYGEVARRLGMPGGARAVGGAVGRNPIPILIPCHRVVGASGRLGGFSSGLTLKSRLLRLEGQEEIGGKNPKSQILR